MARSFEVNGKQYHPSTVLAKEIHYTSDYISKLARDEKVLGTRVGRQWFIEPESLRTYIQQLEVEKLIAKEALSRQRKLEQRMHQPVLVLVDQQVKSFLVIGQSLAVVTCGVLAGFLFWTADQMGLQTADLLRGSGYALHEIATPVRDGAAYAKEVAWPNEIPVVASPLAAGEVSRPEVSPGSFEREVPGGQYTTFPVATSLEPPTHASTSLVLGTEESIEEEEGVSLPFADQVIIREEDGKIQVQPIFGDSAGDWYELSVTEVNAVAQ